MEKNRLWFICVSVTCLCYLNVECRVYYPEDEVSDNVYILDRGTLQKTTRHRRFVPNEAYFPNGTAKEFDTEIKSKFVFSKDSNNVAFVYWKHAETSVIFILTCDRAKTTNHNWLSSKGCLSKSKFYRSADHGGTYELQDKEYFKSAFLHSLYLSPLDKLFRILTDYKNQTIFITNDEGITFTKYNVPFSPTFMVFHPTLNTHIASFDNTPGGENSLYVSENSGLQWTLVATKVRSYFWAQKGFDKDSTLLYIEKESSKVMHGSFNTTSLLYVSRSPYTPNFTSIYYDLDLIPFSVYVGEEFIVVQRSFDKKLYISHDRSATFLQVKYDSSKKIHVHHAILSDDNNELLVAIVHDDATFTLYLSDRTGQNLVTLQTDIIMKPVKTVGLIPKLDFYRVKGLAGTYLVNKKEGSLISYDKGHSWTKLMVKNKDLNGKPINRDCGDVCSLVLYIKVSRNDFTAPLLSKESAPGIILAQGHVGNVSGTTLYSNYHFFISVDGGYTWKEHLDYLFGYAIVDHGGLIAVTPLKFTINHDVHVTTDYGKSWKAYPLTKLYSRIAAIITETSSKTMMVNVFGFLQEQPYGSQFDSNTWIVWRFNFTSLFRGHCKNDDYVTWTHNKDKCFMGQTVSNKRRKSTSTCINGPLFKNDVTATSCKCTYSDYGCDYRFYRVKLANGTYYCRLFASNKFIPKNCLEGDTYKKTKGYTRVMGNKCSGGVEATIEPTVEHCPVNPPQLGKIKPSKDVQAVNKKVYFVINQEVGFYNTTYIWDFADGKKGITGSFHDVREVTRVFTRHGLYVVSLRADNLAGHDNTSVKIKIVDDIYEDAFLACNEPVIVNRSTYFSLQTYRFDGISQEVGEQPMTKFIWSFGGVYTSNTKSVTSYTFNKAGRNTAEVQIVNPLNYRRLDKDVTVFADAVTVDVMFSSLFGSYNKKTVTWLKDFTHKFKRFLSIKYGFHDHDRIFIKSKPETLTKIRIIFVDTEKTKNSSDSALSMARTLYEDITKSTPLLHNMYKTHDIHMIKAEMHGLTADSKDTHQNKKSSGAWIYIVIVVLTLLLCVLLLGFYQYRRKGKLFFWRKEHDIMKKKLVVYDADEDCIGMDGD